MPQLLLDAALAGTCSRAKAMLGGEPLQQAFLAWLHPALTLEKDWQDTAAELATTLKSAGRSVQAVAALGFLVGAGQDRHQDDFLAGARWLVGRNVAGSASAGALLQPMLLLGILVGCLSCGDAAVWSSLRAWHANLSDQSAVPQGDAIRRWPQDLAMLVRLRLNSEMTDLPSIAVANPVLLALARRGLLKAELVESEEQSVTSEVLNTLLRPDSLDPELAAFVLAAYEYLSSTVEHPRLRAPELSDVALALSRLQAALRRWTWEDAPKVVGGTARKWHIDHEYHFQNLLTAVFTALFTDLKDEEWLSSIGPKKPRADLVVPSLQLVIEVKFWRVGTSAAKMVSEIAEDCSLYRKKNSPYLHVVPVIWDNGARTEEHAYLARGLEELPGVLYPTIVSRPAAMVDTAVTKATRK